MGEMYISRFDLTHAMSMITTCPSGKSYRFKKGEPQEVNTQIDADFLRQRPDRFVEVKLSEKGSTPDEQRAAQALTFKSMGVSNKEDEAAASVHRTAALKNKSLMSKPEVPKSATPEMIAQRTRVSKAIKGEVPALKTKKSSGGKAGMLRCPVTGKIFNTEAEMLTVLKDKFAIDSLDEVAAFLKTAAGKKEQAKAAKLIASEKED